MSEFESSEKDENAVFFQKMNIRDLYGCASCGNGIHITIPAKLVRAFDIQPGDELLIRIEEVQYSNIREVREKVDISKPKKKAAE